MASSSNNLILDRASVRCAVTRRDYHNLGGFYFARAGLWQTSHAMRQDWHSAESFTCSQIGARICVCAEKAAVESRQETRVSKRLQAGQPIPTGSLQRIVGETPSASVILGRDENPRSVLSLTTWAFQTFLMGAIRSVRLARNLTAAFANSASSR